jgi:hypothetical protein
MIEVKIREITENIVVPGLLGTQNNQPHKYDQLYFVKSGDVVPDNTFTLKGRRNSVAYSAAWSKPRAFVAMSVGYCTYGLAPSTLSTHRA